jgi:hypothetical protein
VADDLDKELYNKLWDNINNKDTRVWQFISFYGATIGIILGGSATGGFLGVGVLFISIFSFWALSFVYSSEWWSARNRLMVQAIEDRYPKVADHIPSFYKSPRFTTEEINFVSIWVITFIQLFFMSFLIYLVDGHLLCSNASREPVYRGMCELSTRNEWLLLVLLKLLFGFLLMWSFTQREKRVNDYWGLADDFRKRRQRESGYAGCFNMSEDELRSGRLADKARYANYYSLTAMLLILLHSDLAYDRDVLLPRGAYAATISIFVATGVLIGFIARTLQVNEPDLEVGPLLGWNRSWVRVLQVLFIAEAAVAAVMIS